MVEYAIRSTGISYYIANLRRAIRGDVPSFIIDDLKLSLKRQSLSEEEIKSLLVNSNLAEDNFADEMSKCVETACQIFNHKEFYGLK